MALIGVPQSFLNCFMTIDNSLILMKDGEEETLIIDFLTFWNSWETMVSSQMEDG